jgi:hypothetical protein
VGQGFLLWAVKQLRAHLLLTCTLFTTPACPTIYAYTLQASVEITSRFDAIVRTLHHAKGDMVKVRVRPV